MAELDLELLASIASGGLGSWQHDAPGRTVYVKNEDCIGCLRDLQRFFRQDDPEERPAFFAVSKYNFARSDLVPLIVTYPDDYDVVYNALKVATFLTMPSSEPLITTNRAKQEEHMQAVREAFLAQDALAAVVGMLAEPLSRHPRMNEQDAALVQLVITFFKNLVAIPEAPPVAVGSAASSTKDANRRIQTGLLERLFGDNVMDLLLLLAQHSQQRPFRSEAPVLVEIFMHLFCGVDPQLLLDAPQLLVVHQRQRREEEAAALAAAENKRQQQQRSNNGGNVGRPVASVGARPVANTAHLPRLPAMPQQRPFVPRGKMPRHVAMAAPSRHPHSGAVYVRRHLEHNANIVLRHNPNRSELPRLPAVVDARKAPAQKKDGMAANGTAGGGQGGAPQSRLGPELLMRLGQYLHQFLDGAYDLLMAQVFKELEPGLNISRLSETDFLHFVRLATYCTRYVRLREERKLQAKLQQQALGSNGGDKGAASEAAATSSAGSAGDGADRAQAGTVGASPGGGAGVAVPAGSSGGADGASPAGDEEASPFSAISATMGWDCFHWLTLLWIMLSNMEGGGKQKDHSDKNWELQHASVPLLKEMLLTLDLARVAGSTADRRAADRLQRRLLHDDLKESGLLPVLCRLIKGYNFRFQPRSHAVDLVETLHVVLGMLDRLSAAEPGGFRVKATARQGGGRRRKPLAAPAEENGAEGEGGEGDGKVMGTEAAAGEVGASADSQQQQQQGEGGEQGAAAAAGSRDGSPAEGGSGGGQGEGSADRAGRGASNDDYAELAKSVGRSGDIFSEDEEDVERRRRATREVTFEAARRIRQECAHPAILHFYAWLLQGYRTNAAFANHAILSFFKRIAEPHQLNLEPMLYQLSVLRLFEAILSDVAIKRNPDFAELLAFAKQLVRNLFDRMVPDLSQLQQKAGEVGANLASRFAAAGGIAAGGGDGAVGVAEDEQEADSTEREAQRERRRVLAEIKARENAAMVLFVELLFWKGPNVAEDVRNCYNWRGLVDPEEHRRRGGRRGRGSALGDDEGSGGEGGGQLGFASYRARQKELFTEEQSAALLAEFEKRNGRKDCLEALVFEFGGQWKKGQISRQLKTMGLAKGKFTPAQEERMRGLYEELRGKLDCFQLIAEELDAGFTANQVKFHLRKLGVALGRSGATSKFTAEQESRMRELYGELMARKDCAEQIAEDLGGGVTANQVKRHLRKIGVMPSARKWWREKQRDAASDALAAGSDGEAGGSQQRSGAGSGGGISDGSASDSDGGDSGFGSAKSELEGGRDGSNGGSASDSDSSSSSGDEVAADAAEGATGGDRAAGKAARRQAALEALQENAGRRRKQQRRQSREMSPEIGGAELASSDDEEEDADGGRGGIAAQQAAAAAASLAPSGGSSFLSLLDSDGGVEAVGTDVEAPAAKKQRRGGAAAATSVDAEGSSSFGDVGSGDSDGGFESARESEPDVVAAPRHHKRQPTEQKEQPQTKKKKLHQQQQEEGAPKEEGVGGKRRQRQNSGGDGTPGGKRKAEEEAAGPGSTQKRAALEALRRLRQQAVTTAAPPSLPPATEPLADWPDEEPEMRGISGGKTRGAQAPAEAADDENAAPPQQVQAKLAGRRLLKRAGGGGMAIAPAPVAAVGLEDLEDDI